MKKVKKGKVKDLTEERDRLVASLSVFKYILRGTVITRGNICGNPNCRCKRKKDPQLHGPYKYLSHRSRKSINMIFLNNKKRKYSDMGIAQYQELIETIYRISEINFELLRYHYNELPEEI